MNVFVLSTGRCGSTTFAKACRHITNYTSSHESRCRLLGEARFAYPENHIEADNRLAWLLGRLEEAYGDRAFYVHLIREQEATAASFNRRWHHREGIIVAYSQAVLMSHDETLDVCRDYWQTVNANIRLFLRDKTRTMPVRLESAAEDFRRFWSRIGAEGPLERALAEWDRKHNASRGWW